MTNERRGFDLGPLKLLLLIAAVVLFVLAAVGVGHNLLAWGLAALAAALLV